MKKFTITIFSFLMLIDLSNAQTFEWAKSCGSVSDDVSSSIAVDVSGNVYTTGHFVGTVDFDPGIGVNNLTSTGTGADIYVQKLNNNGSFSWAKSFRGSSFGTAHSIALDNSGNIYTTGTFVGTVDFDPSSGVSNKTSFGGGDVFIQKMDANGNLLWVKSFGGSFNEHGNGIAVDNSGNVITTGYFGGTVDFDPGVGVFNLTTVGDGDIFIHKLDANGNFLWARSFGGISFDESKSIAIDAMGSIYTTGRFSGTVDFDPGTSISSLTASGSWDIFLHKLNSSGNFQWAKSIGGPSDEFSNSIVTDNYGNVYSTGEYKGTIDFDPGTGINNLSSRGYWDVYVHKIDTSGNFIWARSLGGSSSEGGTSITTDNQGNVYTTGLFGGRVDFDPGTRIFYITPTGNADVFIQKMDSSGTFRWVKSLGGLSFDVGSSIVTDALGSVYTTGTFEDTANFNSSGMNNLISAGGSDFFIQKMSQATTTGVVKIMDGIKVIAYPNPTKGIVNISFEKTFKNAAIILTDLQGKEVFSKQSDVEINEQIIIQGDPGVYFLSIRTKEGQSVIKLIKD